MPHGQLEFIGHDIHLFVGKRGTIQHPGKVLTEVLDHRMNPDNPVRHVLAGMFRGFERLPSLSSPPENIPRIIKLPEVR